MKSNQCFLPRNLKFNPYNKERVCVPVCVRFGVKQATKQGKIFKEKNQNILLCCTTTKILYVFVNDEEENKLFLLLSHSSVVRSLSLYPSISVPCQFVNSTLQYYLRSKLLLFFFVNCQLCACFCHNFQFKISLLALRCISLQRIAAIFIKKFLFSTFLRKNSAIGRDDFKLMHLLKPPEREEWHQ